MIPREILKKIRQIELRTNRIVTGFAVRARLCEPQHFRLVAGMENSERLFLVAAAAGRRPALRSGARASARFTVRKPVASNPNSCPNPVRTLKRRERRAPVARLGIPKGFRPKAQDCEARATLGQRPQNLFNRIAVAAIPVSSIARGICHNPVGVDGNMVPFTQGSSFVATLGCRTQSRWDWPERLSMSATTLSRGRQRSRLANARSARRSSSAICSAVSFRRAAKRSCISACTCSHGIPDCGFLENSSARRSSSAVCSGVSSSSYSVNSSKICWTSSRRSFSGMFLMRSRISFGVMAAIYAVDPHTQRVFRLMRSSSVIRHSSFSRT